jgi:hypothetical protein
MAETRRGRVRAGVSGYHPGLAQNLIAGHEHEVPVELWSDSLFEAVAAPVPEATAPDSPYRRSRWSAPDEPQADKEE